MILRKTSIKYRNIILFCGGIDRVWPSIPPPPPVSFID